MARAPRQCNVSRRHLLATSTNSSFVVLLPLGIFWGSSEFDFSLFFKACVNPLLSAVLSSTSSSRGGAELFSTSAVPCRHGALPPPPVASRFNSLIFRSNKLISSAASAIIFTCSASLSFAFRICRNAAQCASASVSRC